MFDLLLMFCVKTKTREQREAEVIPKLSEALKQGISVMDNAFVTLELTTERKYYVCFSEN